MTNLAGLKDAKLKRRIDFAEFNKELGGFFVSVWLNVNEGFWADWGKLLAREAEFNARADSIDVKSETAQAEIDKLEAEKNTLESDTFAFLAEFWCADVEGVRSIYDTSPPLYRWCLNRSFEMLNEYMGAKKKR